MQMFYIDEDGKCLGSYDGPQEQAPFNGTPVASSPMDASHQIWNGSEWEWPVEILRQQKFDAIVGRYNAALESGLSYGGKILQLREEDQANLTSMGNEARWVKAAGLSWPSDFAWRMADNSFLAVPDADAMIALGEAAKAEVYRLQRVKWNHVDMLRTMSNHSDISSYDIETGW